MLGDGKMEIINAGVKLSEELICDFEKQLGIELPHDYREFMKKNNGGEPDGNWSFDFFEFGSSEQTSSVVRYFERIYLEETMEDDDLKAGYAALLESGQIPINYLPIADDPFGNIIFLCIDTKNYGKVYFGNSELEDPDTGFLVTSLISDTFSEFLDKLRPLN